MKKLVRKVDKKTKQCIEYADIEKQSLLSQGFTEQEVEQTYDGSWYLLGHAPEKPQALIDQERIDELQAYLDSTDWYAVRYAETGVAIPEDVVTARASAREEISTLRVEGVI